MDGGITWNVIVARLLPFQNAIDFLSRLCAIDSRRLSMVDGIPLAGLQQTTTATAEFELQDVFFDIE